MTKFCVVHGCGTAVAGYSTLCTHHKQAQRRHGHPEQGGVTIHELAPYVLRVEARQAKNATSEAWAILAARWEALARQAQETLATYASGAAMIRQQVEAAQHIHTLAGSVPAGKVATTALAMFLLLDDQPRRFRSDRAFSFQLVRRVRALTEANAGIYWDHKQQRSRKVYRDMPPKVTEVLAMALRAAFGGAGAMLADKDRADAHKAQEERQQLANALESLA